MSGIFSHLSRIIKAASGRLRPIVGDRRRLPRYETRRSARLFDAQTPDAGEPAVRPLLPMVGHTRDISETGLAIVVTSDLPGSQRDEIIGRELRIVLDLPSGLTHVRGKVVRAQLIPTEETEKGYLIGIRITEMNDKDWVHMVRYIVKLRQRT